jgi:hypothetical protein
MQNKKQKSLLSKSCSKVIILAHQKSAWKIRFLMRQNDYCATAFRQ